MHNRTLPVYHREPPTTECYIEAYIDKLSNYLLQIYAYYTIIGWLKK